MPPALAAAAVDIDADDTAVDDVVPKLKLPPLPKLVVDEAAALDSDAGDVAPRLVDGDGAAAVEADAGVDAGDAAAGDVVNAKPPPRVAPVLDGADADCG